MPKFRVRNGKVKDSKFAKESMKRIIDANRAVFDRLSQSQSQWVYLLIYPDSESIKIFHRNLVEIYEGREFPIKIVPGYRYEGLIDSIADRVINDILYEKKLYPHILHKSAVYLFCLNSYHPFIDGNKRTSLITAYFFLLWNGYYLNIPPDADKFLIKIARPECNMTLNDA